MDRRMDRQTEAEATAASWKVSDTAMHVETKTDSYMLATQGQNSGVERDGGKRVGKLER